MNHKTSNKQPATTRWGIIGPGKIAHQFARALVSIPGAKLYAIASRSGSRAKSFAEQYGSEWYYEGYEKIVQNPEIDIIYIATPHTMHYENTLMCLEHGMPVLCEKPITVNSMQLQHLVHVARDKKIFLMEALWTRFLPTINKVLEIRDSGRLGKISSVQADFGFRAEYDPSGRLFNPRLGGGALLDIGIYPVFLAMLLLGKPETFKALSFFTDTGVDESTGMVFKYPDGSIANLFSTFTTNTPTRADICFEKGSIEIHSIWFAPSSLTITNEDGSKQTLTFDEPCNGYQYEAIECMRCLSAGLTESPAMPLDFSLSLMELLDRIRKECGIKYQDFD